ncbi:MAG: calcium-binding protein [Verrucomicrobia bacterium]|nr:calcium-binding protein [Verrucomicrobiota bacterium]
MTSSVSLILQPIITPWSQRARALEDLLGIFGSAMNHSRARKWLRAFANADFSELPPVVTLSAERMPGLWGGYSREKNRIYLSTDCPPEHLAEVLLEEIGHFLDRELCDSETPGEEGARFAALVLGEVPSFEQLAVWAADEGLGWVRDESGVVLVEGAKKKSGGGGKKKNSAKNKSGGSSGKSKKNRLSPPADSGGGGGSSSGGGSTAPVASQPPKPSDSEFQNQQTTQSYDDESLSGNTGSTFVVSNPEDVTIGGNLTGTETIQTDADGLNLENFTQIENASLTGGADISAGGNSLGNVITGNDGRNTLAGREGNDTLIGLGGNDSLDGGSGDDSMVGGTGSDTFVVDSPADVVVEKSGEGTDVVQTSVSHALAANVEHLELTGLANINGTGNELGNLISGNSGNNLLSGLGGNDTFVSGPGQDSLDGGADTDLLKVGANFNDYSDAQIEDIENVEATASGVTINLGDQNEGFTISGFASGSTNITAGGGSDSIIGGSGADTFSAGAGNDTIISAQNDALIDGGADADWLKIGANFNDTSNAQIANIENVEATAAGLSINLADQAEGFAVTGFATGATTFIGGSGADTFFGGSGADSVNAGLGADIILAGAGNDTLIGAENDALLDGGDNSDWLKIGANFNDASDDQIANIENVELTASGLTVNFGNQSEGFVFKVSSSGPTTFVGGAGKDIFTGGASADSIDGGDGEDRLAAAGGNDTVLGAENDALLDGGTDSDWLKIGADFNNTSDAQIANFENVQVTVTGLSINLGQQTEALNIFGDASGSTSLAAGSGADSIIGGSGADAIVAGAGNDTIVGAQNAVLLDGGADTDWLKIGANFSDSSNAQISNIENVEATGAGLSINLGNQAESLIISGFSSGSTNITAGAGSDSIIGGTGADTIVTGAGNDTIVGAQNDALLDGGADIDWLKIGSSFNDSSNAQIANIENVEVTTTELSINLGDQTEGISVKGFATGSTTFIGGSGQDSFTGGIGAESIDGGAGADFLIGGSGNDTYFVDEAADSVTEVSDQGTDLVVATANGYTLAGNVEGLLLAAGVVSGTGNSGSNTLTGNSLGNSLDGGAGIDSFIGGAGNDTYFVDSTADVVTEATGEGTDSVVASVDGYTLAGNVEGLLLATGVVFGTGNSGVNTLTGNSVGNSLDGGTGIDILVGGGGNDTYFVDDTTEIVSEAPGDGTADLVVASVNGYTLAGNVEGLLLAAGVFFGTGNSGSNTLTGNSAGNSLDGGAGVDEMIGGAGNDTYFVDSTTDAVTESDASTITGGVDWVIVSANSYSLSANLENLTYVGSGNATFSGNGGNNRIDASLAGNNNLSGGAGNDTLVVDANRVGTVDGGADNDTLLFVSNTGMTIGDLGFGGFTNIESYDFSGVLGNVDITIGSTAQGLGIATLSGGTGNSTLTADTTFGTNLANSISAVYFTGGAGNDSLSGNNGNDTLSGGNGNDTLVGGSGNDSFDGGAGNDSMVGGLDNDTYTVDSSSDSAVESASQGTDVVLSSITYSLGNHVESLILTGSGNLNGTGNSLNNSLTGNSGVNSLTGDGGDDFLDGQAGIDTLIGGSGNDTYVIDLAAKDTIVEDATISAGTADEIQVNGSFSIADPANLPIGTPPPGEYSGIEVLRYTGSGNVSLTGNKLANTIIAGAGADSLTGGLGADSLIGGSGNDTYVYEGSDTLVELASGGVDEVRSSEDINLTSISEVENIVLTGSGSIAAIGNSSHNSILGNAAGNVLTGGSGNDTILGNAGDDQLDGGAETDSLIGGLGNDTYILDVSLTDQIVENPGEGTDEIRVAGSVDLTLLLAIENIVLQGADSLSAIGNASGNRIQGNAGNNSLNGGGGVDTLIGGAGDDTYFVDVSGDIVQEQIGSGNDQVISTGGSFVLPDFVENLKVNGGQGSSGTGNLDPNLVTGNLSDNSLFGGAGGEDTLVGDEGNDYLDGGFDNQIAQSRDSMVGGRGDDTYIIDSAGAIGDQTVEQSGEGTDTVQIRPALLSHVRSDQDATLIWSINLASITFDTTWDLGATPPDLGGGAQIQLYFNKLVSGDLYFSNANSIPDADFNNLWFGRFLSDRNYFYALPENFENLDIFNQNITINGLISGAGQFQPNFVYGNAAGNYIKTLDEVAVIGGFNNHIDGQGGADTMAGGLGNDTYVVDNSGDLVLELSSQGTDWIFASASCTLQGNVENLRQMEVTETIVGGQPDTLAVGNLNFHGTGNALDNLLEGNSGNNSLFGLDGADTIAGGAGNDTIDGGGGNDSLVGGDGIDSMVGGAGNDIYSVENEADAIVDSSGFDIVFSSQSYVLSTDLEVLVLQGNNNIAGWGNSNANSLVGNSVNNILVGYDGHDTLDGGDDIGNSGGGNDTLSGGAGNDYYFLRNAGDIITENSNQGTDTVFSLDNHNLAVNFENLILGGAATSGQGNAVPNSLTANATADSNLQGLAGNDTIVGLAGNDILSGGDDNDTILGGGGNDNLDGGAAVDSLAGGTGNDTYIVTAGDVVFEATGAGVDEIQSSVGFTLSDNVENLLLTGSDHENGTGNGLSNDITGNTGNNSLFGLGGRDNLTGLAGSDTLDGGDLEDSLVGGIGSDFLLGGDGSDMLNGTDSTARGANEIDTLTGGAGRDLFVLGDGTNAYYNTAANGGDYAYISDFSANLSSFDQLQLRNLTTVATHANTVNGYLVGAQQYGVVGLANSYLYHDNDNDGSIGAGDNLIAAIVAADGIGVGGALLTSDLNTIGIFI